MTGRKEVVEACRGPVGVYQSQLQQRPVGLIGRRQFATFRLRLELVLLIPLSQLFATDLHIASTFPEYTTVVV